MIFLIGILTVLLVVDALLLILLVLIQLPKKEAGAGLAFGGVATDALFGAGSGNVLTKITKFATVAFFVLVVGLAGAQSKYHGGSTDAFKKGVNEEMSRPQSPSPTTAPANAPTTPPSAETTAEPARSITLTSTNLTAPATSDVPKP